MSQSGDMAELTRPPATWQPVAFGLGSNLGDREAALQAGIQHLDKAVDNIAVSAVYESPALDCLPGAGPFLNCAVVGQTQQAPLALLAHSQELEASYGREPGRARLTGGYESRRLDMDLLVFGTLTSYDPRLLLPHPGTLVRPFVLLPLAELWPDLILPGTSQSLADWAGALPEDSLPVRHSRF